MFSVIVLCRHSLEPARPIANDLFESSISFKSVHLSSHTPPFMHGVGRV